jgi:hypothetical protein
MGFGRSQGAFSRLLSRMGVIAVVPVGLMFISMQMMDDLNMLSLVPGVFWTGLATTAMFYKSRELLAPLWLARQYYFFGTFAILTQFIMSYKILQIHWGQDETRKTFANIQSELSQ